MKNLIFHARWVLAAGAFTLIIPFQSAVAQEQSMQPAVTADVQVAAPPKLPYGVADVLKLSQAKISDDIIVNYIHNSGTVYSLAPNDIVYLRNHGVSDQVLNVMVNQRTQVAMAAQAEAAQNAAAAAAQNQAQPVPAPAYAPAPVYDQSAAVEAPAPPQSTVYVIPNSAAYSGYAASYSYPYSYYYGGYYAPVVSYGFGYCGPTYYHAGYHGYGGWHGGYHGSTWHGGSIHATSTGFHGGISHSGGGIHVASGGFHAGGASRGGGGGAHGAAHR